MIKKHQRLISSLCAIAFLIILWTGIYHGLGGTQQIAGSYTLKTGWKVCVNDTIYEDADLESLNFSLVQYGDIVTMECYLPEEMAEGAVLQFYSVHSAVTVTVGGKTNYSYGHDYMEENRLLGYGYHFVQLPTDAEGLLLQITLVSSEKNAFGNMEPPIIGAGSDVMRNFLIERKEPAAISFFMIIFGVIFVFATIFFSFDGPDFYRLLCIAFFALCMGIWTFCNYDLIALFTYNMQMKSLMEFSAIYGAPTFIFGYFYDQTQNCNKLMRVIYYIIMGMQLSFIAVISVCQPLRIIHFPGFLTVNHIIMAIMVVYIVFLFIQIPKEKLKESVSLFVGILILAGIVVWDLFRYNTQLYFDGFEGGHFSNYTYLGTFIFLLSLIIDFIRKISRSLYAAAKNETLEKYAYTDELTGLLNRRRCEEIYDEIDRNKSDYVLIAFDLNNLKKVNDTLGHEAGDQYIREFAKVLTATFHKHEVIRTGGDEFIVVVREASYIDVPKCIADMEQRILQVNNLHGNWNMSTAYGVCYASENNEQTIRQANKIADDRMYQKKYEMKGKKGR